MHENFLANGRIETAPKVLQKWLYAEGSLTQQLTLLSNHQFRVHAIKQSFQRVQQADAKWMGVPLAHCSWVREALLYGSDSLPWVQAKSIFPILSLKRRARIFPHIGNTPIGHYLFQRTTPVCQRRVLYLPEGWTRQSRYIWHGCPFIVQETFLASFEQFIQKIGNKHEH